MACRRSAVRSRLAPPNSSTWTPPLWGCRPIRGSVVQNLQPLDPPSLSRTQVSKVLGFGAMPEQCLRIQPQFSRIRCTLRSKVVERDPRDTLCDRLSNDPLPYRTEVVRRVSLAVPGAQAVHSPNALFPAKAFRRLDCGRQSRAPLHKHRVAGFLRTYPNAIGADLGPRQGQ